MIPLPLRQQIIEWVEEANSAGARAHKACELLGIAPRTLQRWRQCGELLDDARRTRSLVPANKLSDQKREQIITVANSAEFAHLPLNQIVPQLVDRGEYIASESTFYRVLREAGQLQHRQASRQALR
jgi:hypothetical protein